MFDDYQRPTYIQSSDIEKQIDRFIFDNESLGDNNNS